jgi:hypothetical protein
MAARLFLSLIYIKHKGADNCVYICMCIVLSVPLYRKIMSIAVGKKKKEICRTERDKRCMILTSQQRYNDDHSKKFLSVTDAM